MPTHRARDRVFRVLHLEDSELDHELHLGASRARRAERADASRRLRGTTFLDSLVEPWDVGRLRLQPARLFSGLLALELLQGEHARDDSVRPRVRRDRRRDTAVEAMRSGASDYLQKNNLARLVPALLHAVDAAETQARARQGRSRPRRIEAAPARARPASCRPASSTSAPRSRARSTTTSAARSPRSSSTSPGSRAIRARRRSSRACSRRSRR